MLRDKADYEAALREVEELAGCLEKTDEERALVRILLAVEIYEAKLDLRNGQ